MTRARLSGPGGQGPFITEQLANSMISKRYDGQAIPTTNSLENHKQPVVADTNG